MELVALYKRVIGLDIHQAQITACALIEDPDGTTRIEQRQFGGYGDESGAYAGEKTSSFAFLDRFQKLSIPPMPVEVENDLIRKVVPGLPDEIIASMVNFAREVASNFVGVGGGFSVTISPRSLQVWAREALAYQEMRIENPVWESLTDTVLAGAPESDSSVIKELYDKWM
jgi:hypothetical protein